LVLLLHSARIVQSRQLLVSVFLLLPTTYTLQIGIPIVLVISAIHKMHLNHDNRITSRMTYPIETIFSKTLCTLFSILSSTFHSPFSQLTAHPTNPTPTPGPPKPSPPSKYSLRQTSSPQSASPQALYPHLHPPPQTQPACKAPDAP
jgi:hypothetical protein